MTGIKNTDCEAVLRRLSLFTVLALVIVGLPSSAVAQDSYKVSLLNNERVFPGSTLMADTSDYGHQSVVEVNHQGKVIWRFNPHPLMPRVGFALVMDATKLKNGHILMHIFGSGLYEIDREGNVQWKHEDREASHDADRLANGNTLYNRANVPPGENVVVEIDPKGNTVWAWNGMEQYGMSPFIDHEFQGWMHVNSVTRLNNANTLISIRNFITVVEVNPDGQIVWSITFKGKATSGLKTKGNIKGVHNHEPEILPNGNMLVAIRKPQRYVEIDRTTNKIVWEWRHPDGKSAMRTNREINRLPNGNTLLSAADRIVEIAPDGEIVWQIHAPMGGNSRKKFHKAIRLGTDGGVYGG